MSRTFVQGLLVADANSVTAGSLKTLGASPNAVYAAEAADDIAYWPFIVHRWGNIAKGIGPSKRQYVDVWVHDRDRDYVRIDAILKRIEALFSAVGSANATEGWITQIDWQGSSPDLRDDGYDTITRNSTFLVIGSTR